MSERVGVSAEGIATLKLVGKKLEKRIVQHGRRGLLALDVELTLAQMDAVIAAAYAAPRNTVTLSDGSVWEYEDEPNTLMPWLKVGLRTRVALPYVFGGAGHLTAADHRAIADVLDPTPHPDTARLDWLDRVAREGQLPNFTVCGSLIHLDFGTHDEDREEVAVAGSVREALDAAQLNNRTSPHGSSASNVGAVVVDAARGTGEG